MQYFPIFSSERSFPALHGSVWYGTEYLLLM